MALRLIEIKIPSKKKDEIAKIITDTKPISFWIDKIEGYETELKVLLHAEKNRTVIGLNGEKTFFCFGLQNCSSSRGNYITPHNH